MPRRDQPPSLAGVELETWKALIRVSQLLPAALDTQLRSHGESLPRYEILAVLSRQPEGLRMSDLGRLALVSKPRLTVHVAELDDDGFVTRVADPSDGRASIIRLTKAGQKHLDRLSPDHVGQARQLVFDRIAPEDRASLLPALVEVLDALGDDWSPDT